MTGSFSVEGAKVCVAGQRSRTDPKGTFPLTVPGSRFELRSGGRSPHRPSLNAKPNLFTAGVLNGMKNPNHFTYPAKPILREPENFCAARLAKLRSEERRVGEGC